MSNDSTWVAPMVTLSDGTQVASDSEAFRLECEGRTYLAMAPIKQREYLTNISSKRGAAAPAKVQAAADAVEPAYVLDLPTREARRAYLCELERTIGQNRRKSLEARIMELHKRRQGAAQ